MKLYNELAEHYFEIEKHSRDIDQDVRLVLSQIRSFKSVELVDLGCGTGEHLSALSGHGIRATGIDISPEMISVAKRKYKGCNINFINTDITLIDFNNRFEIAISFYGSINYLLNDSDINRFFLNLFIAMKPSAIGIIELWNAYPFLKIKKKKISYISTTISKSIEIVRERGFNIRPGSLPVIADVKYRYTLIRNGYKEYLIDDHLMRLFFSTDIKTVLAKNGFELINIYSNSNLDNFHENSSKMLLLFKKK